MKNCESCGETGIYYQKMSGTTLCASCFVRYIEKKIYKFISEKRLISPNDKICVAVSGGKDSLTLLLNIFYFVSKFPQAPKLTAVLIEEGIGDTRIESRNRINNLIRKFNINADFQIHSFMQHFGFKMEEIIHKISSAKFNYNPCTVCAAFRRRLLNDVSRKNDCNILAIGHNLDDTTQTFLQNIVRNDLSKIGQNPPHGSIDSAKLQGKSPKSIFIPRIKPLINIREQEIIDYCKFKQIDFKLKDCEYSVDFPIFRRRIKNFIDKFDENNHEVKYNLLNINYKIYKMLGQENKQGQNYSICTICGYPSGPKRSKCMVCSLKEELLE